MTLISFRRQIPKKGVMGIETLIIFIAMILVAAVAAGVLLKTSGLLQQRALAVGNEATERIITGFEVASVTANANVTENEFNEIEMLVRLQAGSYDVNFLSLAWILNTENFAFQSNIMHTQAENFVNTSITYIPNGTYVNVGNLDIDPDDSEDDYARLIYNITGDIDALEFNLSTYGKFNASLGDDVENGTLSIADVPIKPYNGNDYDPIFGFFTYTGTASADNWINASGSSGAIYIANAPADNECTFDDLIPNVKFCIKTKIGDGDFILENGELVALRYKLSVDKTMSADQSFDMQIIPKRGTIIDLAIYVPEVLQRQVVTLWP